MPVDPRIVVRVVETDAPDFAALSLRLDEELELRYPGLTDGGSQPADDFTVAVVAYDGDVPVGCGALRASEPGVGEVKRMFVKSQARRRGVAREVLTALESHARALGYCALRLGSGRRQPEALALYESAGYRAIPLFGEYEGGDVCVCYEKSLSHAAR